MLVVQHTGCDSAGAVGVACHVRPLPCPEIIFVSALNSRSGGASAYPISITSGIHIRLYMMVDTWIASRVYAIDSVD